jgi:hypothetical protein
LFYRSDNATLAKRRSSTRFLPQSG